MNDASLRERRSELFTPAQLLELFWTKPLEFVPGSDFRHSDSGYAVLGAIVERVSGRSYAEHMQREIFSPFGLAHTEVGCDPRGATDSPGPVRRPCASVSVGGLQCHAAPT